MDQCQCSSNKLGVHCYECEDRREHEEMVEIKAEIGLRWSEVKQGWVKKKMCKKKTAGKKVEEECCECNGDGQIIVRPAVSAPYLEECTWCDGKGWE